MLFIISCISTNTFAQNADSTTKYTPEFHMGIGTGLTYGGFGGRFVANPSKVVGLFVGCGYNIKSVGVNGGLIFTVPSKTRTKFYINPMYGYNAVIVIKGLDYLNKTYYGFSIGAGLKIVSRKNPGSYFDVGLIVPNRSSEYKDAWNEIQNSPIIEVQSNPWPVLLNIGYNFRL